MLAVARLPRPLRAAVRGSHHLRRRHLHRRARHADRHAGRVRSRSSLGALHRARSTRVAGAAGPLAGRSRSPRPRSATSLVGIVGWYVTSFIVKPNELVREQPFIAHNIELTRQAFALDRIEQHPFPADSRRRSGRRRAQSGHARRTSGCGTGARCRTRCARFRRSAPTTTSPTSTSIATTIDGAVRQMMLAARELNVEKLPESSRNWINEKLIYTHGYGVTMNPVNGFTPEGLPTLVLSNMPVQSTIAGAQGHAAGDLLRRAHQHRRLRQDAPEGVQLPAGRDQQPHVVRGQRRHPARRLLPPPAHRARSRRSRQAAVQRRRHRREPAADAPQHPRARRGARAVPHLRRGSLHRRRRRRPAVLDDGRLHDLRDVSRTRGTIRLGRDRVNYMRNSVKAVVDAYDGTTTFYVFDAEDPIIAAYRGDLPERCSRTARRCRRACASTCAIPSCCCSCRPPVYGLYHMTDPGVFYNREDLWTRRHRRRLERRSAARRRRRWSRTSC